MSEKEGVGKEGFHVQDRRSTDIITFIIQTDVVNDTKLKAFVPVELAKMEI